LTNFGERRGTLEDEMAKPRTVRNQTGVKVEVGKTYGLPFGDQIVVEGFEKKDGDTIVIGAFTTTQLGKTETYQGWAWLSDCRRM
jgi:hypothetical protein